MRYFDYAIKCIIRNFIRFCFKPRNLIVILLSLIIIFILHSNSVFATESVQYTNWNDLALQSNSQTGGNGGTAVVISYTGLHGRAIYFKPNMRGIVNLNFTTTEMHYAYYIGENAPSLGDQVDRYYHTSTSSPNTGLFSFDTTVGTYSQTGYWFVYYSVDLTNQNPTYDTLEDFSNEGVISAQQQTTQAIQQQTNTIQQQTTAIQQQTNTISEINDSITSTDYDDDVVSIDSSAVNSISTTEVDGVFSSVFTNLSNLIVNSDWSQVETININLPFVPEGNAIELRSDLLTHFFNAPFQILISVFWYSAFGLYGFHFVLKIIRSIRSGDILGGISLDDEVITSTML